MRWLWLGGAAALAAALMSIAERPLWRDEYWALFFSDPGIPLGQLVSDRLVRDVHPPLYFLALHQIRQVLDDPIVLRLLNLVWLAGAGFAAWRLSVSRDRFLAVFLLACLTSYWAVFFAAEVRPYAALYGLSILVTVLTAVLSSARGYTTGRLAAFAAAAAAAGMLHYFAALFAAFCGLALGLSWLRRGRFDRFVWIGAASVIAVTPTALWIVFSLDQMTIAPGEQASGVLSRLEYGLEQFLRGVLVKTLGSNLALSALAAVGAAAAWRFGDRRAVILALASAGCVAGVFAMHLVWTPLIKERAFIVIMPAVVWLLVEAARHAAASPMTRRLAMAIPAAAILSPVLFAGEYFKDRERFSQVQAVFEEHPGCRNARIYAYFRSYQHEDYYPYFTRMALTGSQDAPGLRLVEAGTADRPETERGEVCAIAGVALGLRRGDEALRNQARAALRRSGLDLNMLEERQMAGGRHLLFLRPDAASKAEP